MEGIQLCSSAEKKSLCNTEAAFRVHDSAFRSLLIVRMFSF